MRCPEDGATLQQYHYLYSTPIILEQCPVCGGFFAKHEDLEKMQLALDKTKGVGMTKLEEYSAKAGAEEAQHLAYMNRQASLASFFNFMDYHMSGFWGML